MKIIGIKKDEGIFKKDGKMLEYSYCYLHCVYENKTALGQLTSVVKIATKYLDGDLKKYLGRYIKNVYYDKYHKVCKVEIDDIS